MSQNDVYIMYDWAATWVGTKLFVHCVIYKSSAHTKHDSLALSEWNVFFYFNMCNMWLGFWFIKNW